jgi:hypothetical protein
LYRPRKTHLCGHFAGSHKAGSFKLLFMATVNFRLNHANKPGTEGKLKTILCEYYDRGFKKELATKCRTYLNCWDGYRVSDKFPDYKNINKELNRIEADLMDIDEGARAEDLERLVVRIVKGNVQPTKKLDLQKKTSLFTVGRFLVQCKQELDKDTVRRYQVVWRALGKFQKGVRLDLSKVDMSFHDKFKNFLYSKPNNVYKDYSLVWAPELDCYRMIPGNEGEPVGLMDDTVFKYLSILQTMLDWASKREYPVHSCYKTWQIIRREYPIFGLSLEQLETLEALPPQGDFIITKETKNGVHREYINLDQVKDIWNIECRSGQRISDILKFKDHQVKGNIWSFVQKKGNRTKIKQIEFPMTGFCSAVKLIFEKYDYRLPRLTNYYVNVGIKEIAKRCGFTQPHYIERWAGNKKIRIEGTYNEFLSSHSGKKTFITLLAGLGVPLTVISQLTGTSIKTIERHYLGRTDIATVSNHLEKAGETKSVMRIAN